MFQLHFIACFIFSYLIGGMLYYENMATLSFYPICVIDIWQPCCLPPARDQTRQTANLAKMAKRLLYFCDKATEATHKRMKKHRTQYLYGERVFFVLNKVLSLYA